jgi:hypothetical protein
MGSRRQLLMHGLLPHRVLTLSAKLKATTRGL